MGSKKELEKRLKDVEKEIERLRVIVEEMQSRSVYPIVIPQWPQYEKWDRPITTYGCGTADPLPESPITVC